MTEAPKRARTSKKVFELDNEPTSFTEEQIAALDDYARANLDWKRNAVPKERDFPRSLFDGFSNQLLARRIRYHFFGRNTKISTCAQNRRLSVRS